LYIVAPGVCGQLRITEDNYVCCCRTGVSIIHGRCRKALRRFLSKKKRPEFCKLSGSQLSGFRNSILFMPFAHWSPFRRWSLSIACISLVILKDTTKEAKQFFDAWRLQENVDRAPFTPKKLETDTVRLQAGRMCALGPRTMLLFLCHTVL